MVNDLLKFEISLNLGMEGFPNLNRFQAKLDEEVDACGFSDNKLIQLIMTKLSPKLNLKLSGTSDLDET